MVLSTPEIARHFDLKIYVDGRDDYSLLRRMIRGENERGMSFEETIKQYEATVGPGFVTYIEPAKKRVDIVVRNKGFSKEFDVKPVVDLIIEHEFLLHINPHRLFERKKINLEVSETNQLRANLN